MFKFKKENHSSLVDKTSNIASDFRLRMPFWSYRPRQNLLDEQFAKNKKEIIHTQDQIPAEAIDYGNENCMDNLSRILEKQNKSSLELEKIDYRKATHQLRIRRLADKNAYEYKLAQNNAMIGKFDESLDELEARIRSNKFRRPI